MKRSFIILACALLLGTTVAAPVPPPKPAPRPWCHGWGEPLDPVGGCRFRRDGAALRIDLPGGEKNWLAMFAGDWDAPRLLREIEGDFTIQVRAAVSLPETGCR